MPQAYGGTTPNEKRNLSMYKDDRCLSSQIRHCKWQGPSRWLGQHETEEGSYLPPWLS